MIKRPPLNEFTGTVAGILIVLLGALCANSSHHIIELIGVILILIGAALLSFFWFIP